MSDSLSEQRESSERRRLWVGALTVDGKAVVHECGDDAGEGYCKVALEDMEGKAAARRLVRDLVWVESRPARSSAEYKFSAVASTEAKQGL